MMSSSSSSSIFSNNYNRAGRRLDENIKKGPWKAEEDEVLMKHVSKYGPRDWSSIRSNGLLRRTGKSCRLRWVNKLRPNLKNGCKFSAEEERIVIELQQQFGNKWARIATFLPGRTDNDVKNFWSSRKKRLARALQAQPPKQSNSGDTVQNEPSCSTQVHQSSYVHQSSDVLLPDLIDPCLIDCYDPALLRIQFEMMEPEMNPNPVDADCPCPAADFPIQVPFAPMVALSPESQELAARLENGGLVDGISNVEVEPDMRLLDELPPPICDFVGPPDGFFDDFPADMFDHIDSLPSQSNW